MEPNLRIAVKFRFSGFLKHLADMFFIALILRLLPPPDNNKAFICSSKL